jgi:hypothetical protein
MIGSPIWGRSPAKAAGSPLNDFSAVDEALSMGRAELEDSECRLVELRSRRIGIDALQSDRKRLSSQVQKLQRENDEFRSTHAEAVNQRCDLARLQQEYDSMVNRSARWEAEQVRLHQRVAEQKAELDGLRGLSAGAALREESVELEMDQLRGVSADLAQTTELLTQARCENERLRKTNHSLSYGATSREAEMRVEMLAVQSHSSDSASSLRQMLSNVTVELEKSGVRASDRFRANVRLEAACKGQGEQMDRQRAATEDIVTRTAAMNASQREVQRSLGELQRQILSLAAAEGTVPPEGSEIAVFRKWQDAEARESALQQRLRLVEPELEALRAQAGGFGDASEAAEAKRTIEELRLQLLHATEHAEAAAAELKETEETIRQQLDEQAAAAQAKETQVISEMEDVVAACDKFKELAASWRKTVISDADAELVAQCFVKYDLDEGGTVNSIEELNQMCMNLLFQLQIQKIDGQQVGSELVATKVDGMKDTIEQNPLSLEEFQFYFANTFLTRGQLTEASAASSDGPATAAAANGDEPTTAAAANGGEPATAAAANGEPTTAAAVGGDDGARLKRLVAEMQSAAPGLFDKYDYDFGGTMNDQEELTQLCVNMCFTLEIRKVGDSEVNQEWANAQVMKLPDLAEHPLELEDFKVWFEQTCINV